ncbi:hypothetical protein A6D97_20085 [Vibrio sp. ZF57]|nr:hypothetical protein A6D97_20085 [Vibrio sp. ZF57]
MLESLCDNYNLTAHNGIQGSRDIFRNKVNSCSGDEYLVFLRNVIGHSEIQNLAEDLEMESKIDASLKG